MAWSAYFDDFLSLSEESSQKHTDMCIAALFSFLGWKLSEEKLVPFDSVCKVLGVKLDLRSAQLGSVFVANTEDRAEELTTSLTEIMSSGYLSQKDGERLRGRLQFANAQLFGRSVRSSVRDLSQHVTSGRKVFSATIIKTLENLKSSLLENKPRLVSPGLADHVHVYVDASFEPEGYSGIRGLCIDSAGKVLGFFSEQVPPELLELVKVGDKETAILELEMLAISVATEVWKPLMRSKRIVIFTDNEPVRLNVIKGFSANSFVDRLLGKFFTLEEEMSCQVWIERVPSQSNPADEPSPRECETILGCEARIRVEVMEAWVKSAQ